MVQHAYTIPITQNVEQYTTMHTTCVAKSSYLAPLGILRCGIILLRNQEWSRYHKIRLRYRKTLILINSPFLALEQDSSTV